MKASGTPVAIKGEASGPLKRIHIGGTDSPFDEDWLQNLLHRHPCCLPMDQIEPALQDLVPVCMELALPCGFLDNLFMTPDGDIVIAEVKLWRNPEMRRIVIAQALDYATALFSMDYEALEKAVLKSKFYGEKPENLYELFGNADVLAEPDFVDAVNINLKNGRIVVLVVGDGTNTNLENLAEGLQSHAGFHFTFALIALEIFETGQNDGEYLIVPSTLAKTFIVERGIVRIDDQGAKISAVKTLPMSSSSSARMSITSEQFFKAMRERHPELPNRLKAFMDRLETIGVYSEFKKSLNFKWEPPTGKPVNLGYIMQDGMLWTDVSSRSSMDNRHRYLEKLAKVFGGEVLYSDKGVGFVTINNKAPRIETVMNEFDGWYEVIKSYQETFRSDE